MLARLDEHCDHTVVHTGQNYDYELNQIFFDDLVKYCRTDEAYTTLKNVVTKEKGDLMPSYFLAETLKYLYLLFSDSNLLRSVVFNTEAHPFRTSSPAPR